MKTLTYLLLASAFFIFDTDGKDRRLVSNSMNNRRNGGSPKLKISLGIPSLDSPMTNLPQKNGRNSLQPPKMELKSLVPIK